LLHDVFSRDACADRFNLGTWPHKVHPEMEGFVAVLPTPYFAVTAADGSYHISEVPDGSYTMKVSHPRLKSTQKAVTVKGSSEVNFEIAK